MRHAGMRGVTLIDTLVGSALMLVVFLGFFATFQLSIDVVQNNRARAGAIALANEWMEYVRSLTYNNIGTIGGIPAGVVPQEETVTLNGISYTRRTTIQYADDPYDGLGAADTYPTGSPAFTDYKAVRVAISWESRNGTRTVYFVTRVEPQNGVEIACTTPCGTLSIYVANAAAEPLLNARVDVVNPNTNPAINLTTYTNVAGQVVLAGAPVASGYRVTVSKSGYNSAQTYATSTPNPNPDPAHAQVFANQTVLVPFAPPNSGVDLLSSKAIYTYSAVATSTWSDAMTDTTKLDSMSSTTVAAGVLRLTGSAGAYQSPATAQSVSIAPSALYRWKSLTAVTSVPAGTTLLFRLTDGAGNLIPDSQLPGNAAGFATLPVDLSGISTTTYPQIRINTAFTSDFASTPTVDSYSILYDYGPTPRSLIPFRLLGLDKTIGAGPVYKNDFSLQTDGNGMFSTTTLEWDRYQVSFPSLSQNVVAIACNPQPEYLAPGTSQTSSFYLAPTASNALRVEVRTGGTLVSGATSTLSKTGYSATETTMCGQAHFNYLQPGSYTLSVSAPGFQTYTDTNVTVSGASTVLVELNP